MHQLHYGLLIAVFGILLCLQVEDNTKRLLKTGSVVGHNVLFVGFQVKLVWASHIILTIGLTILYFINSCSLYPYSSN